MNPVQDNCDTKMLDLLRNRGAMSIHELMAATEVTSNAVRQRLSRLMRDGFIARTLTRGSRGRPGHRYSLTEKARRQAGSNFADLALVLWKEIRGVKDLEIRRGLLARIAEGMADMYADSVRGTTLKDRMNSVVELFADRGVPVQIDFDGQLPILTVNDCPYPELAERDVGICAVEKMLFSRLLGEDVRLSQCRLDGSSCCQFQTN